MESCHHTHSEKLEQTLNTQKNWELEILENDPQAPLNPAKQKYSSS